MTRTLRIAVLAVAGLLATAATAGADVGDIDDIDLDDTATGTAETAEISGDITCTTTIEYGLILKVTQDPPDTDDDNEDSDSAVEGVGAFGPNSDPGNNPNSPCSTSEQDWELVVQRNRDSDPFHTDTMGVIAIAGTSAENGGRGPGPFIGDLEYETDDAIDFTRSDP